MLPTPPPVALPGHPRKPPERLARWRLCEVIGSGGMGTVYRAERADGVFEQTVAIKLLRPGLVSAATEARFADERRMLGRLRHPNIAPIYDGGKDAASGHVWLAMEHVVGMHITAWIQQQKPTRERRLALFLATCAAVQCAHQNLVVHADIKPSNILVTPTGDVKLVDFGIAHWLASAEPGAAATPNASDPPHESAFTPAYAPPERLLGAPPTPAGDVFSLGVVLAEVLSIAPAVDLDADLRAILGKARAVEPERRYPTVAALAEDVERYRDHFPLQSRPRTWGYVGERFVRRHPAGVVLGVLAAGALIAATAIMTTLYVRAERARAQADQRFQEVRQLARFMIFDLYDEFARVPGTTAGRRTLVSTAQKYLDGLGAEQNAPLDVRLETQAGRARLASVAGVPGEQNLGDVSSARRTLDRAIAELEALQAQSPANSDIRRELAFALTQRAAIDIWSEQRAEAATPRLKRARELLANDSAPRALEVRQLIHLRQAEAADWAQDPQSIGRIARTALDELARWPADLRASADYARFSARMLTKDGDARFYTGQESAALDRYREADALLKAALEATPDRPELVAASQLVSWSIATTLSGLGRNEEAISEFDRTIALLDRMLLLEKNDVALLYRAFVARSAQSEALSLLGRHAEALARNQQLLAERLARMNAAPDDVSAERGVAYETFMRGLLFERAGQQSASCKAFAEAVTRFSALSSKGTLQDWDRTAHLEVARKRVKDACVPAAQNAGAVPSPGR